MTSLQILYQDTWCVVVNKPAGMLVHRSWLDKHETCFVMQQLRNQLGCHVYPVHRLDRPTSGVLLFALDSQSATVLSQQFATHQVSKHYLAVVRGYFLGEGQIEYPLLPRLDKIADKFKTPNHSPQPAITQYRCIATSEQPFVSASRYTTSRYSLMELMPITGRKHQLRRHMTHMFHPIVGDTTYGDTAQNRAVLCHTQVGRLLLHAHALSFCGLDGQIKHIVAPLDMSFMQVIQAFGWANVYRAFNKNLYSQ